jgi:predicted aspartyl protease
MLVDTGAQMTLIDEDLADELNVEHLEDVAIMGVTGSMPGWMGKLHSLELGNEEVRSPVVMVGPRRGMLLLGMDVLGRLKLAVGEEALYKQR